MKHVQAIEYRNKTEPPIEEGWYYARYVFDQSIEPIWVEGSGEGAVVLTCEFGEECTHELSDFDWFGPVRIVKEG